jgi:hypothetical protein
MLQGNVKEVIVKYTFIRKQKIVLFPKLRENQRESTTVLLAAVSQPFFLYLGNKTIF